MCGIAGILPLSPGHDNTAADRQMAAVLHHRGPGDEDYYDDDTLVDAIKTLIGQGDDAWAAWGNATANWSSNSAPGVPWPVGHSMLSKQSSGDILQALFIKCCLESKVPCRPWKKPIGTRKR